MNGLNSQGNCKMEYKDALSLYKDDVIQCADLSLPWEKLANSSICISGATGMIGSFLIDVIMNKNMHSRLNCKVIALGRNEAKALKRIPYFGNQLFSFVQCDINGQNVKIPKADYMIHLASTTHPLAYVEQPIETITANIFGLFNMLNSFVLNNQRKRFLLASSVEIYGENNGEVDRFDEKYCGYIDCNDLRAGYPESKRLSESICQGFISAYDADIVISRLPRVYGGNVQLDDTKAISQFLFNGAQKKDVILKSNGEQKYSFGYVADVVSGLLYCLLKGNTGEAYNIASENSDITLSELASIIADYAKVNVVFSSPGEKESRGYSKATRAIMDGKKIASLGWTANTAIDIGVKKTLDMLSARFQALSTSKESQ